MAGNFLAQQALLQQPSPTNYDGPINTGYSGLSYAEEQIKRQQEQNMLAAAQQQGEQQRQQNPFFKFGVMNGNTGQLMNPGTGEVLEDANGQRMVSNSALDNQAAGVRASQGFNAGEKTKDQVQAEMMTNLAKSIKGLPADQQHLAYERGIGALMGKGVVSFSEAPPWDKGGRDLVEHIEKMKNDTQLGVAQIQGQSAQGVASTNAQGGIEEAKIKQGLYSPQAAQSGDVETQMKTIIADPAKSPLEKEQAIGVLTKMGATGGAGQPVGDAINARGAQKYAGAAEGIKDLDELGGLLKSNPNMSILGAKAYNSAGLNKLLGPEQQRYNTLTTDLNDFMHSLGGEGGLSKNKIDKLSSLLPTVGDNPQEQMKKIENLRTEYVRLQASLDPSGHIQRNLEKQGLVDPRDKLPDAAAQAPAAAPLVHGLDPNQWAQLQMIRQQRAAQSSPGQLAPGDRMDYNVQGPDPRMDYRR